MKKIYAHWCYFNNFGDALNPYLINKLSGCKVIYCNYKNPNIKTEIKYIINEVTHFRRPDINRLIPPFFRKNKRIILAIGSILSHSQSNFLIWGAGYMNESEHTNGGNLYATRGPFSAEKLHKEGFPLCKIYGDPALLLPLIYTPIINNKQDLGIIPHWKEYNYFTNHFKNKNIINLANHNIEQVITQIVSCRYILSTSLHGIIIAHAYGIPALWIIQGNIDTDGIKFKDYFASVGIPFYSGEFSMDDLSSTQYENFPQEIKNLMLPKVSLKRIQQDLIRVCPFNILSKYKLE